MPYLACHTCGFIRHTCPEAIECVKCRTARLKTEKALTYKDKLDQLGFDTLTDLTTIVDNKTKVSVFNRTCQHTFSAQLLNLLNGRSICGVCGPKKRMANALTHWVAKYGKCADYKKFEDYRYVVRKLSEQVYKANIDLLNPQGLTRSRPDLVKGCVQLDHKKPIIDCFNEGVPPEVAADLSNLQVIDAIANLSKQRF